MTGPTPRQLAVLVAVIEAGGVKEAAHRLNCRPSTVAWHLAELTRHTGLTREQAFVAAVRDGLIDVREVRLPDAA